MSADLYIKIARLILTTVIPILKRGSWFETMCSDLHNLKKLFNQQLLNNLLNYN